MKPRASATPLVVMTIGHSTRPAVEFIHFLKAHDVERLVDVRTVPRSRHNPQFNRDRLPATLHSARLHYKYMPGLGRFRPARRDSLNTAWRNLSFRGFADYMQTPEFRKNFDDLIELAKKERIAVMCAEAVPWRGHRSLIADALLARGVEVREITSATGTRRHSLTPWGRVNGTEVTYSAERSAAAVGEVQSTAGNRHKTSKKVSTSINASCGQSRRAIEAVRAQLAYLPRYHNVWVAGIFP